MRCPICSEEVSSTDQTQLWGPEWAHSNCVTAYKIGSCDTSDELQEELRRLSAELDALKAAMSEQAEDNWRKYATEREDTAQAVIERHRNENDSLLRLLAKDRKRIAELEKWQAEHWNALQIIDNYLVSKNLLQVVEDGGPEAAARNVVHSIAELERQLEEARGVLKETGLLLHHLWCDVQMNDYSFEKLSKAMDVIDAAMRKGQS